MVGLNSFTTGIAFPFTSEQSNVPISGVRFVHVPEVFNGGLLCAYLVVRGLNCEEGIGGVLIGIRPSPNVLRLLPRRRNIHEHRTFT